MMVSKFRILLIFAIILFVLTCNGIAWETELQQTTIGSIDSRTVHANLSESFEGIKKFHELLEKCLKKKVIEYTLKPLTKPGDNYSSKLQSLEVKLLKNNDSTEIETLQLVCKTTLASLNKNLQSKLFSIEIYFYSEIIPAIEKLAVKIPETEQNDIFVRFFGSRLSLKSNAKDADADAAIIFENLKSLGYSIKNQFYRDENMAVLKALAYLHAITIATRRLDPTVFYSKVYPYLSKRNELHSEKSFELADKFANKMMSNVTTEIQTLIQNQLNLCKEYFRKSNTTSDTNESYKTIYHGDLWSKNIMIKKDRTATKSIQVKILDFQSYSYESFVLDLTCFLFMNVEIEDLKKNFKPFIEYYHSEFVKVMRFVNCPLDDYTYEKMWYEIKEKAKYGLVRLYVGLAWHQIHFFEKNPALAEANKEFYLQQSTPEPILNLWKCINDIYIENGFFGID